MIQPKQVGSMTFQPINLEKMHRAEDAKVKYASLMETIKKELDESISMLSPEEKILEKEAFVKVLRQQLRVKRV